MPIETLRRFRNGNDWTNDPDWKFTEGLKRDVRNHVGFPVQNGLDGYLFGEILDWKLRRQRGRTEGRRGKLTEHIINSVTKTAFSIQHDDPEYLAMVRANILMSVPGIGFGVASAMLALTFPEEYGVIDYRVWKVIFKEDRRIFQMGDFLKYLVWIRSCAKHLGWQVQHVDFFAWKYYDAG